ncbi:flagellar hook-associated protein FlgL [Marinobacter salicampi]|uniref:flagellar hook-associated protein FlgL n=1 Tax=Marinobacter salicampi TaxID=435907 RepID=UPI001409C486|nr:flagellar hook-associated protein FlgL [Marinobacter salicampi]
MIRISSQQIFQGGVNRLQDLNGGLQKTQEQISTGKRVNTPSDDPVAAARILKLDQEVAQIDQFQRNVNLAENRLEQEESALTATNDLIQRVRELTVQAGNGSLSSLDRQSLAAELRQRLEQMASLANTRDASGEYIFSGHKGGTPAFEQNVSGSWVYQGDEGQRSLEIDKGVSVKISDNGKKIFTDVASDKPAFITEASPNNAQPPAQITTGMMLDQAVFAELYPDDLVIEVDTTAGTFTASTRTSPPVDVTPPDNTYTSGEPIRVAGIQFEISGASDGDRFVVKTSEKQSLFASVEKLIYGLENQDKMPAVATIPGGTSYSPMIGDELTINGVAFSDFTDLAPLTALRDAINSSDAAGLEKVSAKIDANGDLKIQSQGGDLNFEASGTGTIVVGGAKFEDLTLPTGPLTATVSGGQQAFDELIASSLSNLDNAQETILETQTEIGGRMNAVESTREFLGDTAVYTKDIRSQLQDVDYAEAISRLSFQSFVLEAAQQSFARVSQISLFDRL